MESVSFQASLKGLNIKPDGIEVKLKTAIVDGVLLRELAPMMLQAFLDVTIMPPVRQHELPFSGTIPFAGAKEPPAASEAPGNAEPAEQASSAGGGPPAKIIDSALWPAREGEPGPNVGMILRNSTDDINYRSTVPELSDEELRYCLERETRKSGLARLRAEARRRGLKLDAGPARERDAEDKDDGQRGRVVAFF